MKQSIRETVIFEGAAFAEASAPGEGKVLFNDQ
jgi:hypothetical protein